MQQAPECQQETLSQIHAWTLVSPCRRQVLPTNQQSSPGVVFTLHAFDFLRLIARPATGGRRCSLWLSCLQAISVSYRNRYFRQ